MNHMPMLTEVRQPTPLRSYTTKHKMKRNNLPYPTVVPTTQRKLPLTCGKKHFPQMPLPFVRYAIIHIQSTRPFPVLSGPVLSLSSLLRADVNVGVCPCLPLRCLAILSPIRRRHYSLRALLGSALPTSALRLQLPSIPSGHFIKS